MHDQFLKDIRTVMLLAACERYGITRVALGVAHKSIPASTSFPFGAFGSAFSYPPNCCDESGNWPAIWKVCRDVKVRSGCGNSNQCQIDQSLINIGVYHLVNGAWITVEQGE